MDDEYDPYLPSFWDKDLVKLERNIPLNAGSPVGPHVKIYDSQSDICYLPDQATATH